MNDYAKNIGETVARLRREKGLTQEALADRLGVTYQAVSKWENCASCPDIALLPGLAEVFGVTLDTLFGVVRPAAIVPAAASEREAAPDAPENAAGTSGGAFTAELLPWEDDGMLRVVVFEGRTLLDAAPPTLNTLEFTYVGEAKDVQSALNLTVRCQPAGRWDADGQPTPGGVRGNVNAGRNVECGDVGGSVNAGSMISCDDVNGDVNAGNAVNCDDVGGDVNAGNTVNCDDVGGEVNAGSSVSCGDVSGSVTSGGNVSCGDVGEYVQAEGATVNCGDIGGTLTCAAVKSCGDIDGDLNVTGSLSCGDVSGSVTAGGVVSCGDIGGALTCAEVRSCGDVAGGIHYQK